ncbi:MAG: insulinase family protein [Armatimonadetes bacterium]|nr:insulinase family protein [Armatimonadota bacterium]
MSTRPYGKIGGLVILALLIQAIAITGALAQESGVYQTKLANGLTVLIKESHAAPVFTAQVWFKVGSRNEYNGITGISHMLEHMLFNTSKNFKKGEISDMVRKRGGIENAATWTDFTYYWQLLSSENLDFSLKTLAERVGNAKLLDKELQNERTVVLSELQGHENEPDSLLYYAVMAQAFKAHAYHWPTIGWQSDVEHIDDQQLQHYYHTYYHPNDATLVLVGDVDKDVALPLIKKYFGSTPAAKLPRPPYTTEPRQRGERTVTIRQSGNAERVMLGYHIPALIDEDSYALRVVDQILSGGRSGRLYQALVEKQLATSTWSMSGERRDPALFMIAATARQGVSADQLEKAILDEVEKLKSTPPTEREMQAAKNQLEAYFIFQNDSVSDQGEQLGYYNTLASWTYLNTLIPKVKAVTPEQVQNVVKKYFNRDNMTVGKFIPTARPVPGGAGAGPMGPARKYSEDSTHSLAPGGEGGKRNYGASHPHPNPLPPGRGNSVVKPTRVVLDNGIIVIVQENHSNPTIAINGNVKAGGYFDPKGKEGVASLTAEMLGRGTEKRPALELASAAEFVGASVGASADDESAHFTAKSLSKDFPLMLDLLSDELRNASFPEDQFVKARGEELSGLEESKESPRARAMRAFYNNVFPPGHPYHQLTFDEAAGELKTITRDDLVAFHKAYYRPDTMIIAISGDVKADDAIKQVKKFFGDWRATGPTPKMDIPKVLPGGESKRVVIPMMDKSEVDVVFGHPMGIRRSDHDFYAARVMNQILGGGGALGSILGDQIREKRGLAYDVYSTFDANIGAGPWYAALGTNPKHVDQAVDTLKSEIAKYVKNGATPKEYEEAREFIIGVFPIALETNEGMARVLLNAEFYGLGMDYLTNYAKIYRSVTLAQVNAAAKKYLRPDAATLVIAGPYSGK